VKTLFEKVGNLFDRMRLQRVKTPGGLEFIFTALENGPGRRPRPCHGGAAPGRTARTRHLPSESVGAGRTAARPLGGRIEHREWHLGLLATHVVSGFGGSGKCLVRSVVWGCEPPRGPGHILRSRTPSRNRALEPCGHAWLRLVGSRYGMPVTQPPERAVPSEGISEGGRTTCTWSPTWTTPPAHEQRKHIESLAGVVSDQVSVSTGRGGDVGGRFRAVPLLTFDRWLAVGTGLCGEGEKSVPGSTGEKAAGSANVDNAVARYAVAADRCFAELLAAQRLDRVAPEGSMAAARPAGVFSRRPTRTDQLGRRSSRYWPICGSRRTSAVYAAASSSVASTACSASAAASH
jgi:hypothetical protein